jgi:subtilisin family serine protease
MFRIDSLQSDGFDWNTAYYLALASRTSYLDAKEIHRLQVKNYEFRALGSGKARSTEFFCAATSSKAVLAIRGTDSLADWLGNLKMGYQDHDLGRVHAGFAEFYATARESILRELEKLELKNDPIWLTGHSLGGALALFAASDLQHNYNIAAIYTYGQPSFADRLTATRISDAFATRYFRIVNDQDIVAKIPPHFVHAGQLYRFDSSGGLRADAQTLAVESTVSSSENGMSDEDFDSLQIQIRQFARHIKMSRKRGAEGILGSTLEGMIPGVADHSLDRYIAKINAMRSDRRFESVPRSLKSHASRKKKSRGRSVPRPYAPQDPAIIDSKLFGIEDSIDDKFDGDRAVAGSGSLPDSVEAESESETDVTRAGMNNLLSVLVRTIDGSWVPPDGSKILSRIGPIISLTVSEAHLDSLGSDPAVLSVELSRNGGVAELVVSRDFIRGNEIVGAQSDEIGDKSIVGLIDTGIDICHSSFLNAAGDETRILAIWDQYDNSGPSPHALEPEVFTQNFGRLYTHAEIEQLRNGPPNQIPSSLRDYAGHGTHVASIAAGRATGGMASGVAPGAALVAVIPALRPREDSPNSIGYSNSHIAGLDFLDRAASGESNLTSERRPLAINVSLGMNAGPHDGSSPLEIGFDQLTQRGTVPGRVIVKSAGNERGQAMHARETLTLGVCVIEWESLPEPRLEDYLEAWFNGANLVSFELVGPGGERIGPVDVNNTHVLGILDGNECELELQINHRDNGDNLLIVKVRENGSPIREGIWTLEAVGESIIHDAVMDLWFEREDGRCVRFVDASNDVTVSVPGTAESVITVAASNSSVPPRLHRNSSRGLTRLNQPKPEISAPGTRIRAARSAGGVADTIVKSGTSMAAPHVTGALALVMSAREKNADQLQFTAKQLRSGLIYSAQLSAGMHDPGFGFGILDVTSLFDRLKP